MRHPQKGEPNTLCLATLAAMRRALTPHRHRRRRKERESEEAIGNGAKPQTHYTFAGAAIEHK